MLLVCLPALLPWATSNITTLVVSGALLVVEVAIV